MSMQPGLFLRNTDRIITGYGFKKSIPVGEWLKASDGTALTSTTTNVGRGNIETSFNGIIGAASGTFALNLDFRVPWDYDQSIDRMKLRFLAQMSGTTNTAVKLDAAVYQKKVNTALGTDLDPTISAALPNSTTKADWVEILLDQKGLIAGSGLSWVITSSGTHTTDAIWIYSAEIEYFSDLVYFNREIRRS